MKILFVLLVLLPLVELSKNNEKYCKCNPLHVLCDKETYNVNKKIRHHHNPDMNPKYKKGVVENLNSLRHAVASGATIFPQASNMQKLVYSDQLERAAKMQIRNCNPWIGFRKTDEWCNRNCYKCNDIDGLEVHFSKSFTILAGNALRLNQVLSELAKPPRKYVYDVSDNYKIPKSTKMASDSNEIQYMALQAEYAIVGCSYAFYFAGDNMHYILVCAFGPVTPGMTDRPPYKVGTQCRNCSTDTKCSEAKDSSLCEYEPGKFFNRTEGIAEDGSNCMDPKTSKGSVKEIHLSGGGSKKTIVLSDPSKGNDTDEGTAENDCKIINLILPP